MTSPLVKANSVPTKKHKSKCPNFIDFIVLFVLSFTFKEIQLHNNKHYAHYVFP